MLEAFDTLKQALITAPVLAYPDFAKPFIVATDASKKAIGAVLSQIDENGREHPIHNASRALNDAENDYSTYEFEGLAIVFAFKKFRHYDLCQNFILFTAHEALKYVINTRDPHGRIARWMSVFADYDFDVHCRPGPRNANTDYLSRSSTEVNMVLSMGLEPDLMSIVEYLTTGTVKEDSSKFAKAIKVRAKNYVMFGRNLFRRTAKGLLFIPAEKERIVILDGLHDEIGYWDLTTTYKIIMDRFLWLRMRPDIPYFVRICDPFQKKNPTEQSSPYGMIPVSGLFHTWCIEIAGPLKKTEAENKYLLLAVEHMSR